MGDKKKKVEKEEDLSTEQLQRLYRSKAETNGVSLCKILRDRIDQAVTETEHITKVHLWEEMGPVGVRAMMETFTQIQYKHLKSLRLWRVKAQDEGIRAVCIYIDRVKLLEILDLMDNEIGLLGCQFLTNVLHPSSQNKLTKLKLDHNEFGTAGLEILAQGLASNDTIEKLSLNYCGITADGAKSLQQILSNLNSKIFKLKISGNLLKNEGTFEIFRALEINQVLEKIKMSDNQFTLEADTPLLNKIVDCMTLNTTLGYYDLRFNVMNDDAAMKLIGCVEQNKTIYYIEASDHISQTYLDKLKLLTKKRKPKKKKKSKKKKK